jgi:hypothetical protein
MSRSFALKKRGSRSRGNEGRDIFYDHEDRKVLLETLGETSERFDVEVYAFVLPASLLRV